MSTPSNTSHTMSTPSNTSNTMSTPSNTSHTMSTPSNIMSSLSNTSNTMSTPTNTSNTMSTPSNSNVSNTMLTPSNTSNTMSTPSNTSNTMSSPSNTSHTMSSPSNTSNTMSTPTNTSNTMSTLSNTSNTMSTLSNTSNTMSTLSNTSNTMSTPTNTSNTMSTLSNTSNTMSTPSNTSNTMSTPSNTSNTMSTPSNTSNTMSTPSNTMSTLSDTSNTMSTPSNTSNTMSTPSNTSNTMSTPSNTSNTMSTLNNTSNTVSTPSNTSNTMSTLSNTSNTMSTLSNTSNTMSSSNTSNTMSTPSNTSNTMSTPANTSNTMSTPSNTSNTMSTPANTSNTMSTPSNTSNTMSSPSNTNTSNTMSSPTNTSNIRSTPTNTNTSNTMSTPGSINTNRSRYARLLGIMTAGGGRGRARNSANITFGLDVEEKEKKDSRKHKEKSDDDDDSSKHKEKSDDDDDSSKHKEKSDVDDDSSKHKEKSDDDDSSKHKENNLSALDYSVCDDHNDSPEFDCRVHHKNSNLSECNCSVNGESDLPAMDNNECKDYNSTNLHDFNKHTGRKSCLPGHNLNKSREGSMPELNINLCTEAVKQPHSSAHQSFSVPQSNHKTEQGNSVPVKINHRGPIFGNNNVNIRIPSDCSESEEEMEKSAVSNVYFAKVMDQLNTFYLRIKVCSYTQSLLPYQTQEMNTLSRLEEKLDWLRKTTTTSELNERLRSFTLILQADVDLSSSFLSNFLNYIQSVMELEKDLTSVTEILQILVPSVNTMLRSTGVKEDVVKSIQNDNLVYSIYQSVVSTFSSESQYSSKSIKALLGFQCGDAATGGRSTKAHVVRMTPQESVAVFQDTFGDKGNQFDMYLIYVWQVYKVYEVRHEDGSEHPLVHSLMDVIEESGKYLSILRAKELQAKEHSDPFSTQFNNKMKDDAEKSLHPVPEANFEWTDFRLGRVNANGVAFLVNSPEWVCQLKELSTDIEKLEVKKRLKDVPSLGLTLGLELKSSIIILDPNNGEKGEMLLRLTYIRVRVVRTAGPVVRVYGVDTGTVHTCPDPLLLILLPPPLVQHPPCGRLARLPVVPCPASSHLAPQLAFLVALCQRPDLTQYLCAVDISPTASWLQVPELTQLTLHLLETLLDTLPNSHLLPHISLIIADYLLRGTGGDPKQSPCTNLAVSLLTTAMTTSPRLRLMLANEGLFITLCELGLNGEDYHQAWESLVTLLGGRTQVEKWASLTHRAASNVHHSKHHHKVTPKSIRMPSKPVDVDRSLGILHLSTLATRDRNWDLEIRRTLTTRQLCPYQSHGGWQWDQAEVVACDVGKLHHGHILSVRSDLTHHLIVDKCISNIRMNTLLQVILGMLNTGVGGKMYIGLTQAGVVQGVRMTRDQRDCFMLGFSKMVTSEITPSLLPCDSLIQMVPVLRPATPQTHFHPNHIDYFIIVLTVRPQPELIYRCRDDPVPVLVRGEGGATTTLRGPILTRTLAQAKTCTQALQQKVASEKENLLKMIWDEKSRQ